MHLREIQKLLVDRAFNPYIDINDQSKVLAHLVEEIGELSKAWRIYNIEDLKKEFGDCVILLCFFAESIGLNLQKCTIDKIYDNIQKGKFRPNSDCHGLLKELAK